MTPASRLLCSKKHIITAVTMRDFFKDKIFYHGTNSTFEMFDPKYSAQGHVQEGPGYYLTSSIEDAKTHGSRILQFRIVPNIILSITRKPTEQQIRHIQLMMRKAPDLADTLTNWDENPIRAFNMALEAILQQGSAKECYESVWYDFYRDNAQAWLARMVGFGYTGILVPRVGGVFHFVLFDTKALRPVK